MGTPLVATHRTVELRHMVVNQHDLQWLSNPSIMKWSVAKTSCSVALQDTLVTGTSTAATKCQVPHATTVRKDNSHINYYTGKLAIQLSNHNIIEGTSNMIHCLDKLHPGTSLS